MPTEAHRGISFARRFQVISLVTGLVAGCLFPPIAYLMVGEAAFGWPFVVSCLAMGATVGMAMYWLVISNMRRQLKRHLQMIHTLGAGVDRGGETLEDLEALLIQSIRQTESFLAALAGTVDEFVPHYKTLAEASGYLSGKTEEGFTAALQARNHIEKVEEKQRDIGAQIDLLAHRTQDEAALARELSASLEEMALAMEHSNAKFLETTSTVDEMAGSVREVAAEAGGIARGVEQTARDLDGIGESLEMIRRDAVSGSTAAQAVKVDAENGLRVVELSVHDMERIALESQKAVETMERLGQRTVEVEKIITVIRELVSDTELLAFNAAIIAAQAGAEGRGFSVVAEEIRDLADRTTGSAQEIQTIVRAIAADTGEASKAVSDTGERIEAGKRRSQAAGEALRKIVTSSEQAATTSAAIVQMTGAQGERAKALIQGAGESLRAVKTIAKAMQEQQTAIGRIQQGVLEMKAAGDQISRGINEQVRAKRELDRGLEERNSQITQVKDALQQQNVISQQVFQHFATSEQRLLGNSERAKTINRETANLEELAERLRELTGSFGRGPHTDDSGEPRPVSGRKGAR